MPLMGVGKEERGIFDNPPFVKSPSRVTSLQKLLFCTTRPPLGSSEARLVPARLVSASAQKLHCIDAPPPQV